MGSINDPSWQTERANARALLASVGATPPSTPLSSWDSVDASHPLKIKFVLPSMIKVNLATLSFSLDVYRTYSSLTLSTTGAGSSHSHGHSHTSAAHSHGHNHSLVPESNTTGGSSTTWDLVNSRLASSAVGGVTDTGTVQSDATSTTPGATGSDSTGEASHTHSISGTSILGISEGTTNSPVSAIAIDGVDVTASLGGGPWTSDTVGLDLTTLMPVGDGKFHTITLTATALGRIFWILRLG